MPHWVNLDVSKLEGIYSKKRFRPINFSLNLGLKPMGIEEFDYIVKDYLEQMGPSNDEFFSVLYEPKRSDCLTVIQTFKETIGEDMYYVEICKDFDDGLPFHVYKRSEVSLESILRYFRTVLVDFECPDTDFWDDDTENQLKQMGYEL